VVDLVLQDAELLPVETVLCRSSLMTVVRSEGLIGVPVPIGEGGSDISKCQDAGGDVEWMEIGGEVITEGCWGGTEILSSESFEVDFRLPTPAILRKLPEVGDGALELAAFRWDSL
jgi:hypothetical protein